MVNNVRIFHQDWKVDLETYLWNSASKNYKFPPRNLINTNYFIFNNIGQFAQYFNNTLLAIINFEILEKKFKLN